jgi:glutamyl-tRNA synthetase
MSIQIEPAAGEQLSEEARGNIAAFSDLLGKLDDWSVPQIEAAARVFAESKGLKLGKVAQPLRAALTGRTISPGIFEVMVLIGKNETLARLSDQARRS